MVTARASSSGLLRRADGVRRWALVTRVALLVVFSSGMSMRQVDAQTQPETRIEVEIRNGLLSLDVKNAPLDGVIRAIGEVAGFNTVVLGPLDTRVTQSLTEVPVYDVVRRLARDTIFVMIHAQDGSDAEAAPIKEIRLYRSALGPLVPTAREAVDPAVLAGLLADDARARIRAVQTIGGTGEASSIALLEHVIVKDDDPMVRGQAAAALGQIGGKHAVSGLQAALGDPVQSVRVQAVRGLGRIGEAESAQVLGELLLHDADRRVRRRAAWSLGGMKGELARSYLEAALIDADGAVRRAADQGLERWAVSADEGL